MGSTTWYGSQAAANVESCNIGALAVVAPLMARMKVAEIIDRHLPSDPQAEFSFGTILSVLIAARLYSPTALVNVSKWASESGADLLWGIPAEKLTDDRLAKALDAFFSQRHSILASFAMHVSAELCVPLREVHYDPTHLLFHGAYEDSEARQAQPADDSIATNDNLLPADITKGRRMEDAAHGGQMIHVGLCTHVDEFGPLPIFGHTVGGNINGRSAIAEQFAIIKKHLKPPELTMLSDRGTYSPLHLARLRNEGYHAICSAPWNDFQAVYDQSEEKLKWNQAQYLSQEQERRRTEGNLPQEHYELAELKHKLVDPTTKKSFPVRLLFVFSTADQKVTRQQREKQIVKIRTELENIRVSVAGGNRSTDPTSIKRRVERMMGTKASSKYFTYDMIPLTASQQKDCKRGLGRKVPEYRFEFQFDKARQKHDEKYDGLNVIVVTQPERTADALFTTFKRQSYAEHCNHIFKGPLAVRPVFLKLAHRVEALVFLMMMSLTLYFIIQRTYRETCDADATIKERRTTTRTILSEFAVYTVLITTTKIGRVVQPLQPNSQQREIFRRLALQTPAQILCNQLPRPPTCQSA